MGGPLYDHVSDCAGSMEVNFSLDLVILNCLVTFKLKGTFFLNADINPRLFAIQITGQWRASVKRVMNFRVS